MSTKSIFTLAAITLASIVGQTPAQAGDTFSIVRDHRGGAQTNMRDHRETRRNEVVRVSRKDCRLGYEILHRSGYKRIGIINCRGAQYTYVAEMDRAIYGARMNAYSGSMKITYMGPVRSH